MATTVGPCSLTQVRGEEGEGACGCCASAQGLGYLGWGGAACPDKAHDPDRGQRTGAVGGEAVHQRCIAPTQPALVGSAWWALPGASLVLCPPPPVAAGAPSAAGAVGPGGLWGARGEAAGAVRTAGVCLPPRLPHCSCCRGWWSGGPQAGMFTCLWATGGWVAAGGRGWLLRGLWGVCVWGGGACYRCRLGQLDWLGWLDRLGRPSSLYVQCTKRMGGGEPVRAAAAAAGLNGGGGAAVACSGCHPTKT